MDSRIAINNAVKVRKNSEQQAASKGLLSQRRPQKNNKKQADIARLKESVGVCQQQSQKFKELLTGKRIANEKRKAKMEAVIAARKNIREYAHKSSLKF